MSTQQQPGGDATRLFFCRDLLVMVVPIEGQYPSVNHTGADGFRGGRKSKAYRRLFAAVKNLGERAVAQGWEMINDPARLTITRYATTRAPRDAINLGVAEANALTECGAWIDDAMGNDANLGVVVDPAGPDRVLITIQRLTAIAPNPRVAPAKRERRRAEPTAEPPPTPRSGRVAYVQGKPVPYEDALALLHGDAPARGAAPLPPRRSRHR